MAHAETGTANFTSTILEMRSFTLTAGADAAVANLREGTVAGTIKFVVKAPIAGTTHVTFSDSVVCSTASGAEQVWFIQLSSGTTPQMTITGD